MKVFSYPQALECILSHCQPLPAEPVNLAGVLGRIPSRALQVVRDDPPQAKSAMDGFALRSRDTRMASKDKPAEFEFTEVVGAGHLPSGQVAEGKAIRIMTGAVLPDGADAVVKQEDIRSPEAGRILVPFPLNPGDHVVSVGVALRSGQPLLPSNVPISAQGLGLLASQGLTRIDVHGRPRVAVLSLGDELVEPGQPLESGQLYVSNSYELEALARNHGALSQRLGIVPDDPDRIEALLRPCLKGQGADGPGGGCDIVITLGGTLKGDFDFVDQVLSRLGAKLHFRRTLINMGGSTLFATRGDTLLFGLPGSPMASWLAFEKLVLPALWRMGGRPDNFRPMLQARLGAPLNLKPDRTYFLPCRLEFSIEEPPTAIPLTKGMTLTLPPSLLANGLIHWPGDTASLPTGAAVAVEWLGAA